MVFIGRCCTNCLPACLQLPGDRLGGFCPTPAPSPPYQSSTPPSPVESSCTRTSCRPGDLSPPCPPSLSLQLGCRRESTPTAAPETCWRPVPAASVGNHRLASQGAAGDWHVKPPTAFGADTSWSCKGCQPAPTATESATLSLSSKCVFPVGCFTAFQG